MRGRKPKPTKLKALEGNPGHRALNANEPQLEVPDQVPYAPRHLSHEAKREWRRVVSVLMDVGLYTDVDRAALAMYCQAWGRWVEAEKKVKEKGEIITSEEGGMYQNPWLAVANRAWEQLRKVEAEFGMTPSSRSRVTAMSSYKQLSLAEELGFMVGTDAD